MSSDEIRAKVEASSLGTPAAKAARESVTDEQAARVVARAKELKAMSETVHSIAVTLTIDTNKRTRHLSFEADSLDEALTKFREDIDDLRHSQ